jgi:hypothetical protein
MTVDIVYTPKQYELFFGGLKKWNIIRKGRRAGFTQASSNYLIQKCYEEPTPCLWVDTINSNIQRYFERCFLPNLRKFPSSTWSWNVQQGILRIGESYVDMKSAENPMNIEGQKYKIIILNEAGIILRDRYLLNNAILPMMLDYEDSILIAGGCPRGKQFKGNPHPFFELYQRALGDTENYRTFFFSAYDNPFIKKKEIDNLALQMDEITRKQEIFGEFVDLVDRPFLWAFHEDQHVINSYQSNPHLPIICSFDFNKNPMTCIVGQSENIRKTIVFDEIIMNNGSTVEVCAEIRKRYKQWQFKINITGDASGRNRSPLLVGNVNHYTIIKRELQLKDREMLVEVKNPDHATSRILCNSVLQNAEFYITKNCKVTLSDMQYATTDSEGGLIKTAEAGLHCLDAWRYLIGASYPEFLSKPWIYQKQEKSK